MALTYASEPGTSTLKPIALTCYLGSLLIGLDLVVLCRYHEGLGLESNLSPKIQLKFNLLLLVRYS